MSKDRCKVEGCKREVTYAGLGTCTGHYRRYERMRNEWLERYERTELPTRVRTRLLRDLYVSGPLRSRRVGDEQPALCAEPGCDKLAVKRGLCNAMYTKHMREGTMPDVPLRP